MLQAVPPKYDLFAISQHYGSLGGGHYTATCEFEGQGWYAFNDSGVNRIEAMDPADSARSAYVLFYRRQDDLRSDPSELTALLLHGRCEVPIRSIERQSAIACVMFYRRQDHLRSIPNELNLLGALMVGHM